jgi:carbon-monoxide dehydrogenase medium subunit
MIPAAFDYERPKNVADAVSCLGRFGSEGRVLAGGQSLLPLLKRRAVAPKVLIDIAGLTELRAILIEESSVTIGALVTQAELTDSDELRRMFPLLVGDLTASGDAIVRKRGTFGGSLAFGDPAADWPAIALALDARLHVTGVSGRRTLSIHEFLRDAFTTALQAADLLTGVTIPVPRGEHSMVYRRLRHPASGYALIGVAAVLGRESDEVCSDCRVAVTGAGHRAVRATAVETELEGKRVDAATIERAAERATEGIDFLSDLHAGPEYRAHLARIYVKRALVDALRGLTGHDRMT